MLFGRKKRDKASEITTLGSGLISTAASEVAKKQAAQRFATPDKYSRELYDSGKAGLSKKNVKLKSFSEAEQNNTKVLDPYTNKELKLRKIEAKEAYGGEWTEHLAEGDHITPLKKVYDENHDKPWISNDDIKNIANSDENLQTVSRKFNNAKRARTNEDFVNDEKYLKNKGIELSDESKAKAIEIGKQSEKAINRQMKKTALKNAVKTGHDAGLKGAKNAAVTAVTISGVMNIVSVIKGEKKPEEALKDCAIDTGKAASTAYVMTGGLTTISHTLSNSESKFIKGLAKSNVPGYIITAVIVTGNTITRYVKGEISTQDCICELGEKGLNFATAGYSMAIGQALIPIPVVGGAVGLLIGSLLTSSLYSKVVNDLKTKKLEHDERMLLISEAESLRNQEIQYRADLERYIDQYFKDFNDCFDNALNSISESLKIGDYDGIIRSANTITKKLNGVVNYDSVSSFNSFLNDSSVDIF